LNKFDLFDFICEYQDSADEKFWKQNMLKLVHPSGTIKLMGKKYKLQMMIGEGDSDKLIFKEVPTSIVRTVSSVASVTQMRKILKMRNNRTSLR
jgi:hypothetical protein